MRKMRFQDIRKRCATTLRRVCHMFKAAMAWPQRVVNVRKERASVIDSLPFYLTLTSPKALKWSEVLQVPGTAGSLILSFKKEPRDGSEEEHIKDQRDTSTLHR